MWKTAICSALMLPLTAVAAAQTAPPSAAPASFLSDYSRALEELARWASRAVVQIRVHRVAAMGDGEQESAGFVAKGEALGSGVIVEPDGYILTNAHVVRNARRIDVELPGSGQSGAALRGATLPARLVGMDTEVDLAVLKIEGRNLPTLSFLDSDILRQGQLVLALGSPVGLANTLTHGVISATARQLRPDSPVAYIQTDAPINPGNSGGPLVDAEGRIAGINTMIFTQSGGNEGIGFAIPANLAQDVYRKLRKNGRVRRGVIGVSPQAITPKMSQALGLPQDSGVILSDVAPHGAAEAAGLLPGDVVLSADGKPMRAVHDLYMAVYRRTPGEEMTLEVQRGQQRLSFRVAVLEKKSAPGQLEELVDYDSSLVRELGILALTVDERVTPILTDLRRLYGVAVAAVPAEFAGLNPGLLPGDAIYSVNNRRVETLEQLKDLLKTMKSGDPIALHVERAGQLIYVVATLQ